MQVPISWLTDYVEIELSPEELAHALTMAGLETRNLGSGLPSVPGVITARIEKIERHPSADKLTFCQVRPGEDAEPLGIVCGAPNIKEGDVVPLALVGAVLPDGTRLKRTKIRGVTSEGMMCSERELGISDDHEGIWILPPETPLGKPLAEALTTDDALLETEPTPNRGDLLSVLGVAREIAAITGKPLRTPEFKLVEEGPPIESLTRVDIEDYDGCPRYVARLIQGVAIKPSPEWLAKRLEACGMRAINNIVDVTNYVMLELGQPLHAFDFNRLNQKRIVVRRAKTGETFTTLDEQERKLRDDTLMICDGFGPVAIAGVMGGLDSEVVENTRDILLESACFKPTSIRRTARLLGIPSESSRRFDKGVDPIGAMFVADRAIALMRELAGGKIAAGAVDAQKEPYQRKRISLRPERTNQILGADFDREDQKRTLLRLPGLELEDRGEKIEVTAPSYRPDLGLEIDLIEEIARLMGYHSISATMPRMRMAPLKKNPGRELAFRLRERLAGLGFNEVVNTNFEDPRRLAIMRFGEKDPRQKAVRLENPLSENESLLRTSLLPKLLANLVMNRSRGDSGMIRIYEINTVFERTGPAEAVQRTMLSGLISPELEKSLWETSPQDPFYELKGVVEQILGFSRFPGFRLEPAPNPQPHLHPGKQARVMAGADEAGALGELHPRIVRDLELKGPGLLFDLHFDLLTEYAYYVARMKLVSKFPPTLRDLAIVVDEEVTAAEVIKAAKKLKSQLLERLAVFDVFRGGAIPEGKKSMAFHVIYQSLEKTLTDQDVQQEHERLIKLLAKETGASLR